mmetsp:Transcript_5345/g.12568  ORF Transcript_5345/g.12568 Transcript_5345/m.12568 type:complete len:408 (+) Transcript_5345:25-1248(+)|eukprot:CAMPEP_0202393098 /NCGR_PEP_ID=MMETSP1127-20130417/92723_1 /ASSEMBLY_ACC=CAM_ASM_000462 /TAXON_ID=3047 /ORGANISM="Dunaliella tertiolecta, Strain CCMP1320" /LENGTH=407 /DNA_ID=CAMNT_0048995655 /DNA_START=5 /DNA_END=1228 /DNA_ORIENTATION=-
MTLSSPLPAIRGASKVSPLNSQQGTPTSSTSQQEATQVEHSQDQRGTNDSAFQRSAPSQALPVSIGMPACAEPTPPKFDPAKQWRTTTKKIRQAQQAQQAFEQVKKVSVIDMYATEVQPKSHEGGWLTMAVWAATVIYLVILVVEWIRAPATTQSAPDWTIGRGPWPMSLQCHATSGCLFSNRLTDANTLNVASRADPEHRNTCLRIPYNEALEVDVVFSIHPYEGISVLYDPTTTDETMIEGFGVSAASQIRCARKPDGSWDKGCVVILKSQAGPGLSTLQYVETENRTETGQAKFRREYFLKVGSNNGTIQPRSTECVPDPSWRESTQSRLQMSSFYHTVLVEKDDFWLFLWGTAGGAFTTFFQVAGLILMAYHVARAIHEKRMKSKCQQDCATSETLPVQQPQV